MSYQVHITSTAEHDIMRAADYIEFTLKNPNAADNLLDAATEQIGSLADLPQKFHLVDDPVLASWGIRFVIINNYLAFYTCLLYTSPSPRDMRRSRMPSSA